MLENSSENLKRGIVLVFIANLINLIISLANGFILPKYISVDTYANIKTYQLYTNYIGVLVFGYSDGLYLKYGGHFIKSISDRDINISRSNLLIFQGIMTMVFATVGFVIKDYGLMIAALTVIPVNISATFKNILQATGEFKAYSGIMNYTAILTFVGTMILLFAVKTDNAYYYICIMAAVTFIGWFLLERKLKKTYRFSLAFIVSIKDLLENIRFGAVLMLGNFSSILMTSIDRWFVKFLLTTTDFAYYSFVVSTETLIAIFINPIVTTMYNHICVTTDYKGLRRIKRMCMIFALVLVSSAFPAKFILEVYLTDYLGAKYVLFILFSTDILFMVIKGIYVNIYKSRRQQSIYFKQLIIAIILGCVFNVIFYYFFKSIEGIAFATLLSVFCWYIMCCISVKEIRPDWKEIVTLAISITTFILCGFFLPSLIGLLVYAVIVLALCTVFMFQDFIDLIQMCFRMVKGKLF